MFAWINPDNATTAGVVHSLSNNGTDGYWVNLIAGTVAGDPFRTTKDNDAGTGDVSADTSAAFTALAWNAVASSYRSDTSRDSYLNGGNKGSNTTSRTDPTPNFISIGALHLSSGFSLFFDGSIAEAYFFDVAPTDAQQAILALGIHPLYAGIPFANIRGHYPLLGEDNNRVSNGYPNLAATASPTFGSHPPNVFRPRIGALISL